VNWTDDKVEALKSGWRSGLTSREIGRGIGISDGAVRGKRSHLGLPSRSDAAGHELLREGGRRHRSARPAAPKGAALAERMGPLAGSTPRPWTQRRFGECCFPVGGAGDATLSCCLPTLRGGGLYCAGHLRILRGSGE
jgi:hypothetical protein